MAKVPFDSSSPSGEPYATIFTNDTVVTDRLSGDLVDFSGHYLNKHVQTIIIGMFNITKATITHFGNGSTIVSVSSI